MSQKYSKRIRIWAGTSNDPTAWAPLALGTEYFYVSHFRCFELAIKKTGIKASKRVSAQLAKQSYLSGFGLLRSSVNYALTGRSFLPSEQSNFRTFSNRSLPPLSLPDLKFIVFLPKTSPILLVAQTLRLHPREHDNQIEIWILPVSVSLPQFAISTILKPSTAEL